MDIVEQQLHVIKEKLISKDGEVVELHPDAEKQITQDLIYINKVKNKEEKERKKAFYDMQKVKTEFQEFISEELGNFYFNFYKILPDDLANQYKFRFLYLSCFIKHEDKLNRIGKKYQGFILEKELKDFLMLSPKEYCYTKKAFLKYNLIIINDDKTISVNKRYCLKGRLNRKESKQDYTRIFHNGIKELYEKSLSKDHKKIGLLVEMLPYVNYNHNILCFNPKEPDVNFIDPISVKNLCEIIGYSVENQARFKKQLLTIKVNNEYALLITDKGETQTITINPRIYYKGNDLDALKNIINYFIIDKKNI